MQSNVIFRYVHTPVCVCVCVCVCVYMYMCVYNTCMFVYMYVNMLQYMHSIIPVFTDYIGSLALTLY